MGLQAVCFASTVRNWPRHNPSWHPYTKCGSIKGRALLLSLKFVLIQRVSGPRAVYMLGCAPESTNAAVYFRDGSPHTSRDKLESKRPGAEIGDSGRTLKGCGEEPAGGPGLLVRSKALERRSARLPEITFSCAVRNVRWTCPHKGTAPSARGSAWRRGAVEEYHRRGTPEGRADACGLRCVAVRSEWLSNGRRKTCTGTSEDMNQFRWMQRADAIEV